MLVAREKNSTLQLVEYSSLFSVWGLMFLLNLTVKLLINEEVDKTLGCLCVKLTHIYC